MVTDCDPPIHDNIILQGLSSKHLKMPADENLGDSLFPSEGIADITHLDWAKRRALKKSAIG